MLKALINPSQIVTVNTDSKNYKRGTDLGNIYVLTGHSILIENNIIKDIIPNTSFKQKSSYEIMDLTDKIVLPGLVECHTHSPFAGSRANEFKKKLQGISYEEIAKEGGGINYTVQSVRNSSFEDMVKLVQPRVDYFVEHGITTLEMKSGYGLSYYDEIKLLQVIKHLNDTNEVDIIPTFLGAHTFPPEYKNDHDQYIDIINNNLIPYISENNLATFCDAFCETTAFSAEQVDRIFTVAGKHGLKLKLHTDQFNVVGGIDIALKHKATSADHLEVAGTREVEKISKSDTVAVLLPGVSFFLNYDYAPARDLIDNGAIVALATDYNPGSSHIADLNLIMSLASLKMKMSIEETISAVTINAAKAVGMENEVGSIEIGKKADFAVFDTNEYSDLVYSVGRNLNTMTIKNGNVIFNKKGA